MSEYRHGAYSDVSTAGNKVAASGRKPIVYIGTAPVHQVLLAEGESYNVNRPVLVNSIGEAKAAFGYSDDWGKYTLCEAMARHLEQKGVGPLVLINVLDPTKASHKNATKTTISKTPASGRITIPSAEDIIGESLVVKTTGQTPATKVRGQDYNMAYNMDKQQIVLQEINGGLGTDELSIEYYTIKPSGVTNADVIGTTDDMGLNTGIYCLHDVYPAAGVLPEFVCAPGFSSTTEIHEALYQASKKINGHWDAYLFSDLPLSNGATALTLDTIADYKQQNGYNKENETVYFPMALGTDGRKYHLSTLAAANFQELLIQNSGIPYMTASNTECGIIQNLYMGEANTGRLYDDRIINKYLNANGIASACFCSGAWRIWGAHSAEFGPETETEINVSEINTMMLYYVSNDFQARRNQNVDKPMTPNDLKTMMAEEQARLDALKSINALIYGVVKLDDTPKAVADILMNNFGFIFDLTPTPLVRSLTAHVNWTDEGFTTYYGAMTA